MNTVYGMKLNDELIYVGKTTNYGHRLRQHKHNGKRYDKNSTVGSYKTYIAEIIHTVGWDTIEHITFESDLNEDRANELEIDLIKEHDPLGNWETGGTGKGKKMCRSFIDNQIGREHSEETKDKIRKANQGSNSVAAKLTEVQAMEIFKANGSQQRIAELYGISHSTVSYIKHKKTWAHIHDN